ncbi:MAG: UDP-glucose 4-epimerase GalE [Streptosporangiaceae bacterium]
MTIMVTGGAGYIGSHTCADLLAHGHDVVVVDDFSNSTPEAVDALRRVSGRDVASYRADVRDGAALGAIFAAHPIDSVIHFAAKKSVPESVQVPLDYYDVNVAGTASLVRSMTEHGVRRIVFSSSCSVYGDAHPEPLNEDDPPGPTNPYARSKLICEQLLADVCVASPDLSAMALRYFNPVGAHPSGDLGEVPTGHFDNLMPRLCAVAAGQADKLQVFGTDYPTPDGSAIRDYVHVMDVAEAHRVAIGHLDDRAGMRLLNVGTGTGVSVLGLIDAFTRACGVPVPYALADRRPGDVASLTADPSRIAAQWGWRASRDVTQMCQDAWRFAVRHPAGYQA